MTDQAAVYDLQERTGNPEHASVDAVCDRILARAAEPRTAHPDAHLDAAIATVVERYGEPAVRDLIRRILVDQVPFRTAAVDLDMEAFDGVRIGTTAGQVLRQLNAGQQK